MLSAQYPNQIKTFPKSGAPECVKAESAPLSDSPVPSGMCKCLLPAADDLSYILSSLKGVIYRIIQGSSIGVSKADTRSLDDSLYNPHISPIMLY